MTHNVFGGTLNLAVSVYLFWWHASMPTCDWRIMGACGHMEG